MQPERIVKMKYSMEEYWEEFQKLPKFKKILDISLSVFLLLNIGIAAYLIGSNNYYTKSFFTLFGISILIAFILYIPTINKICPTDRINKIEDRLFLFAIYVMIISPFIYEIAFFHLKYTHTPYYTTHAFVHEYTMKNARWYRYGNSPTYHISHDLYFSDRDKRIIGKARIDLYVPNNTGRLKQRMPKSYHCYLVAYRQNVLLVEIREVKNLGAMSKQECLRQS